MNPLYAEYLMGHKTGLMKSYFKPTDQELLEVYEKSLGYIAMIPYLTIKTTEEENEQLQKLSEEQDHVTELRVEIEKIKALINDKPIIEGN
jgi:hypothetical protein